MAPDTPLMTHSVGKFVLTWLALWSHFYSLYLRVTRLSKQMTSTSWLHGSCTGSSLRASSPLKTSLAGSWTCISRVKHLLIMKVTFISRSEGCVLTVACAAANSGSSLCKYGLTSRVRRIYILRTFIHTSWPMNPISKPSYPQATINSRPSAWHTSVEYGPISNNSSASLPAKTNPDHPLLHRSNN